MRPVRFPLRASRFIMSPLRPPCGRTLIRFDAQVPEKQEPRGLAGPGLFGSMELGTGG